MPGYKLFAAKGGGSMIVEAAFTLAGVPLEVDYLSWTTLGLEHDDLKVVNPLMQVPTLVCPDGRIMTESAAILMHLADLKPEAGLFPPPDHARLRRLFHAGSQSVMVSRRTALIDPSEKKPDSLGLFLQPDKSSSSFG